jgi:hypothetical protein
MRRSALACSGEGLFEVTPFFVSYKSMPLSDLRCGTYYCAETIWSLWQILTGVMIKDEYKEYGVVLPSFQAQK